MRPSHTPPPDGSPRRLRCGACIVKGPREPLPRPHTGHLPGLASSHGDDPCHCNRRTWQRLSHDAAPRVSPRTKRARNVQDVEARQHCDQHSDHDRNRTVLWLS